MGADAIDKTGNPLPDETITACLNSDAVLFGAIGHPKYDNDPTAKVRPEQGLLKLRKTLQLYANIRPIYNLCGIATLVAAKAKAVGRILISLSFANSPAEFISARKRSTKKKHRRLMNVFIQSPR